MKYYLGIDIGASGGRHILGHIDDGRLVTEEIYRFPNGALLKDGCLIWDTERLFREIKAGMAMCAKLGKIPVSVGIDTWGVDFVLLDGAGNRLGEAVSYRDSRTDGMDAEVYRIIPEEELYLRTGIQKQKFNTIFQLMALKETQPEILARAEALLMLPDYFNYLLTGRMRQEFTDASTTGLLSPVTRDWDRELIGMLGYPGKLFGKIVPPGTIVGPLKGDIAAEVGFGAAVTAPCTHDTASAVAAVPAAPGEEVLYISSGTWSLTGTEVPDAICTAEARKLNFTNEGGYDYRVRLLKNIMGLWMIQSVKAEIGGEYSFSEICEMASGEGIDARVDCNDERFLAPRNMTEEVARACAESGQQVPRGLAQTAAVIYKSLADCCRDAFYETEEISGKTFDRIRIVGGGSNAAYLNQLIADAADRPVYAGPAEATAIGNIAVQMIADGVLGGLEEARSCIAASCGIEIYKPK